MDRWLPQPFSPATTKETQTLFYGGDLEPFRTIYLASFADAVGERWGEGMCLLDYGCGMGKLFNFASARLKRFEYLGVEPQGSHESWGELSLSTALKNFAHDSRARFGFIGTKFMHLAISRADVAVLISILTHMDEEAAMSTLRQLTPVMRRGCCVFSVHHSPDDRSRTHGNNALYGFPGFHERAYLSRAFVESMAGQLGVNSETCGVYDQPNAGVIHTIYRFSGK